MRHAALRKLLFTSGCALFLLPAFTFAINDGIQLTPALGWNSWNQFACAGLNQAVVLAQAVTMATRRAPADWMGRQLTMKDAGYRFINLDDCWEGSSNVTYNTTRFPQGFVWLCDTIRRLGLLPGLYTSAGTATCAGYPAQYNADSACAMAYAHWGYQYLKEDWCNVPGTYTNSAGAVTLYQRSYNWLRRAADSAAAHGRWKGRRYADSTSPRYFTFSLCNWGAYSSWTYGARCGHSARMSGDISGSWASVLGIINLCINNNVVRWNERGFFNDPDMLEVGRGMNATEDQAHYDLWVQMQSPLLTGNDLSTMSNATLSIFTNTEVNAINQDSLNWGGRRVRVITTNAQELWYKRCFTRHPTTHAVITDSSRMKKSVILFNRGTAGNYAISRTTDATVLELNAAESYQIRNLWTHQLIDTLLTTETAVRSVAVGQHGTVHLLFTPLSMIVPVIPDNQLKQHSDDMIAALIKGRKSAAGLEIFVPASGMVALYNAQGRQIVSFIAANGGQWYQVPVSAAMAGTFIVKASLRDRVLTKALVLAK